MSVKLISAGIVETQARDFRQKEILNWAIKTFGIETAGQPLERQRRFLEEALEWVHASGMTHADVQDLVHYVYAHKGMGKPQDEAGGVMITAIKPRLIWGLLNETD